MDLEFLIIHLIICTKLPPLHLCATQRASGQFVSWCRNIFSFYPFSSDQKDPFSRSPLTLEMIQKHAELKQRIEQWLAEVKAKKKSLSNS